MGALTDSYSSLGLKYSFKEKRSIEKWTLMLPGSGCEYWKKTGGCTMCGFNNSTQKYTHGYRFPSLAFWLMYKMALSSASQAKELLIYNGGSFFNDNEIPASFKRWLYQDLAKNPSIEELFVESRCEYISQDKLVEAMSLLGGKKLTVAIGLESQNDHVRNKLIRKGLSKKMFEEKVALLRELGVQVSAYVFLKPVGLSEKEALEETIKTIEYALSVEVNKIDLSCAFIQEGTKMAEAYHRGEFQPPSLWSILEIIELVQKNNWPVSIGGFTDEPPPIAVPSACPDCSPQIYKAIEQFRQTRHLGFLPDCTCKNKLGNSNS